MAVKDWSATAGSNTGILSGITLDGSVMTPPQVDNAFRDMAAQIASQLGKMGFKGADIASAATTNLANATGWYVDITGTTTITALGTVDAGQLFILRFADALTFTHNAASLILPGGSNITTVAGDAAFMMSLGSGNWRCVHYMPATGTLRMNADGLFLGSTSDTDFTIGRNDNDGYLEMQGGNDALGGKFRAYGASHASQAGDVEYYSNNVLRYHYDLSATTHQFNGTLYAEDDVLMSQNSTSAPGAGNNTQGFGFAASSGAMSVNTSGAHTLSKTSDGTVLVIASGGTSQGGISVSGATVAYNAFMGAHWSQLVSKDQPEIWRGTICETIDELSDFEDHVGDRLPKFKVSDTAGTRRVYGVFHAWESEQFGKAMVAGLGAFFVRMQPGAVVEIGDYIESAGDGCGRVQADDILRSSTVAKVTSATVVDVYRDGSFIVPCTLHCG